MSNLLAKKIGKTITDSFTVLFLKVGGTALAFLITIYITRNLGADMSGSFFFLYSIILFFSNVSRCGFDNVFIRYISPNSEAVNRFHISQVAINGLTIILTFSLICTFLLLCVFRVNFFGLILSDKEIFTYSLVLWTIPLITLVQSSSFLFQATGNFVVATLIFNVLVNSFFLGLMSVSSAPELSDILYQLLLAASLAFIVCLILFLFRFQYTMPSAFRDLLQLLKVAFPMWLTLITNQLLYYLPIFIGGIWLIGEDVAFLSVSQRMSMFLFFFLVAINYVTSPRLSRALYANDIDRAQKIVSGVTYSSLAISIFCILAILIGAPYILTIFGAEFVSATGILSIYMIAQIFSVAAGCADIVLLFSKQQKWVGRASLMTLSFSIVIYPVCIHYYGAIGAAVGVLLSSALRCFILIYYAAVKSHIFVLRFPRMS